MRNPVTAAAVAVTLLTAACANTPSTSQMAEQNATLARRSIDEVWSQKKFASIADLYAADYVSYTHGKRDTTTLQQRVTDIEAQYPGFKVTLDDVFATSDHVAMRWTFSGTNKATGTAVTVPGLSYLKVANGKFVEGYGDWDDLGLALASGFTLTPPAPAPKGN